MRKPTISLLLVPIACLGFGAPAAGSAPAGREAAAAVRRLPLAFEENRGQSDPAVRFFARIPGRRAFLTDDAAWVSGSRGASGAPDFLRIALEGADPSLPAGEGRLPGATHYLTGDPSSWRRNVPSYSRVRYPAVYPGIDLVYYGNGDRLEFDFEVSPGFDPGRIRLSLGGAGGAALQPNGDLCLAAGSEERRLLPPVAYQTIAGEHRPVEASYLLLPSETAGGAPAVGFRVGAHDRRAPLVIDPVLLYSTYLGGTDDDEVDAIAVDIEGNVYVAGRAYSANFPVTAGAPQHAFGGNEDTYVTKINAAGTAIVYSTYLGGSDRDFGNAIAVDALGQAVVAGRTISPNFPGAANSPIQNAKKGEDDGFVAKLDATGSHILFSTYLGGSATDKINAIALDPEGNIFVAGETASLNFPGTAASPIGPSSRGNGDVFVAELDSGGFSILYAAYLGGSDIDGAGAIAVDRNGSAYVAGGTYSSNFAGTGNSALQKAKSGTTDGFLTKIGPGGTSIVYSTYLGGSADDGIAAVAVDGHGNAIVAGYTTSPNFPGTAGGLQSTNKGQTDGFVAEIDPAGSAIVSSTYLGGTAEDYVNALALDALGDVYVAGYTESPNFTGTAASTIQPAHAGNGDAFVAELTPGGRALVYSTYLGGSANDEAYAIAVHSRSACVGGVTYSTNFPGASASPIQNHFVGGLYDGFVVRISAADVPPRSFVPVDPAKPALVDR